MGTAIATATATATVTAAATATATARRPRADAERNRRRIVAAALEVLLEHGADAPLDEIARRAGVGNATVYRHFPDRTELIRSVTLAVMVDTAELAESALAEEADPARALRRFVHRAADGRIGAACASLGGWFDREAPDFVAARERVLYAVDAIITRGQEHGVIRPDIAVGDVVIALSQLSRPLPGTGCLLVDRFVHRHLDLLLDGFCTPDPSVLSGAAATLDDLRGVTPNA